MTKDESDLIIAEQNKSTEEILKAVAKVKSDYHELCKLKDMRIAELEAQIEKMKCCYNCEHGQNECYCSIKHSDICDLSCWDKGCDEWKLREIKENGRN